MKSVYAILLAFIAAAFAGCRSPGIWRQEADDAADRTIAEFQQEALGETESFSIEEPSETLRSKLMSDQQLPSYTNRNAVVLTNAEPVILNEVDCLQVAARNSKAYQSNKEDVFRTALALDLERDAYRNTWSGLMSGLFSSDQVGDTENRIESDFSAGLTRKLKSGATIAGKIGLDVVKLLTLDRSSSYGLLADATITMPLLRGAGRAIVTEPLTQAERDVMYALWNFDQYRKSFAVQIASEYFSVLQTEDQLRNAIDNVEQLERSYTRAEALAQAGRMPEVQVDQTRQDLLRARTRVLQTRQNAEQQLDAFKQTLGLPVDAAIDLDKSDLEEFSEDAGIADQNFREDKKNPGSAELIRTAFEKRPDLRVAFEKVADARRKVMVARDALRTGMELEASSSNQERRYSDGDKSDINFENGQYKTGIDLDLPWERTDERNTYRLRIIALNKAERDLEEEEDQVKKEVRNTLRKMLQAQEDYIIQQDALKLAERRVESTQLFLDAGRADTRDLLEAEEDRVSAKNAVTAALVSLRITRLELRKDTGELDVAEEWESW